MRPGFWNYQSDAMFRHWLFRNYAVQHKSCGDGVYMYCAESSGRVAVRTDLPCRQKGDEEWSIFDGKSGMPGFEYSALHDFPGCIFYQTDYIQGFAQTFGTTNPFLFVVAFVGVQGLIEAAVCCVIAGAVSRTLAVALKQV